jgi:hypothetical protein
MKTIVLPVFYIEVWFLNLRGVWGMVVGRSTVTDERDNVVPLIIPSFRPKGRILSYSKVKQK